MLTAERLRELLHYDPETGVFTWRVTSGKANNGAPAGWIGSSDGVRQVVLIGISHRNYKAHRLAWLHTYGAWPVGVIDHINGDPLDNRISNLRDTSQQVNSQNQRRARSDSKSGLLGAYWDERDRCWKSHIKADGRLKWLGRFDTPEEAHAAYLAAKRKLHEGCTI
jgi:hypothetical protein